MNDTLKTICRVEIVAILATFSLTVRAAIPNTETSEIIYSTGFEANEGFNRDLITGHDGWLGSVNGASGSIFNKGNGLVEGESVGWPWQQLAFIGFTLPESAETVEFFNLFHQVTITNFPDSAPIIHFDVAMEIVNSENNEHDVFGWVAYNSNGNDLFSLDFNSQTKVISYILDDGKGAIDTGSKFDHIRIYDLRISMNFRRNLWCAILDETVIVNNQPITTKDAELTFSGIDAVWVISAPGRPGDNYNYMLFDNYSITRARPSQIATRVGVQGILPDGKCVLRVFGELDAEYQIEASPDLNDWTPIKTGRTSADEGILDFVDDQAPRFSARFYRAGTVP